MTSLNSPKDDKLGLKQTDDDIMDGSKPGKVAMERTVGIWGAISLIVGCMIGSGIFVTPGGVIRNAGSVWFSLIIWTAGGILCSFGAITYIELSTVIPSSGAEYAYILSTFGAIPGFLTAWASVTLIRPALTATICLAFAQYSVGPFVDNHEEVAWAVKLVACVAILAMTFLNCASTKVALKIQIFFTISKLLTIVVIVGSGLYNIINGKTIHFERDKFESVEWNFGKIARAFFSGLYAYDGWNELNMVAEEVKNPYKNLPRAILIGLPLVTACYVLVNVSYLTAMSPLEVADSSSVAMIYSERVLGLIGQLMPLAVALSTLGAANGTLFTSARLTFVAGREGHLPQSLSFVHVQGHTPVVSLILNSLIAMFLAVALDIEGLIDFFSFPAWIFYGSTAAAMIVLRYTRPQASRPYKAPIWMAVTVIIVSTFLVVAPVLLEPRVEYLYATLFILSGLIYYVPFVYLKMAPKGVDKFSRALQLILKVIPAEDFQEETISLKGTTETERVASEKDL